MIPYRLDTLQLIVAQCSTGWFQKVFIECKIISAVHMNLKTSWLPVYKAELENV